MLVSMHTLRNFFRKESIPAWLSTLVVLMGICFLCYYGILRGMKQSSERLLKTVSTPQWFANGIAITKMSEEGNPYQQLFAGEMVHYAQSKTTQLENIRLKVYAEEQSPWQLSAKKGEALHSEKLEEIQSIDLLDHILLSKEASLGSPASQMTTEYLRIFPNTRKVETDKRVDFSQPGNHVSSIGMEADFNTNTIILRNQVRSEHEPKQAHPQ